MGRHGGGSRSGGRRSSSHSSGSSGSGGSSFTTKKKPFNGCYNRCYYDSRGIYHKVYTTDRNFGTKVYKSNIVVSIIGFIIMSVIMTGVFLAESVTFGSRVNGDKSKVMIEDTIDCMTSTEEQALLKTLHKVYEESGMPIYVYIDNFEYKEHYSSIEAYSEDLYYRHFDDLNSMVILYTEDVSEGFEDWDFDIFCEDGTYDCLSDAVFDKLISSIHASLYDGKVAKAINTGLESIMTDLTSTSVDWYLLPLYVFLYGSFIKWEIQEIMSYFKSKSAYEYFKKNPDKLSNNKIVIKSTCPNCAAANTKKAETCAYCGTLLVVENKSTKFV